MNEHFQEELPAVTVRDRSGAAAVPPPSSLAYVDQANYKTVNITRGSSRPYLYSDSATSCIIVIVVGVNAQRDVLVTLSHLDSPECIDAFFSQVLDRTYVGQASVFAQGANPPGDPSADANAKALERNLSASRPWNDPNPDLHLQEGDPQQGGRGQYGIDLSEWVVSNQPFALELMDRDGTGGEQVIFCIMRRQLRPPIQVWNADEPFPPELMSQLVDIAAHDQKDPDDPRTAFTYIVNLQDQAIRTMWSSTPEVEAPWFSDELKQASCLVRCRTRTHVR